MKGKKTGGRSAGTPNKLSLSVKESVLQTFANLGGIEHMTKWAKKEPAIFYKILSKCIPTTVAGDQDNPVSIQVVIKGK